MSDGHGELPVDGATPDDAADEAARRAKIEQRLRDIFRLAGDGEPVRQLMHMVIEYRWRLPQ
ncbi:MAG: hypothetical protein WAZ34_01420 [Rhodocyclaceae bacterium]